MDNINGSKTIVGRQSRIPVFVWILGAGLIIALAAIFVFNISVSTVGYYALFALFAGSHFFMHAGHGNHSGHDQQSLNQDKSNSEITQKDRPAGHSGGCH